MSFIRYPTYDESGTAWSPSIPSSWKVLPAKRGFNRLKELNVGMKCKNRLSLTMNGVLRRSLDDLDGLQASEFETYQIFQKNDLVFKLIDLQNVKTSRVGIVHEEGIMSPAYIRLEHNKKMVLPRFGFWYFTDLYKREIFNKLGEGVRQTLGAEDLLALPFFFPALEEQKIIIDFLNHETAKIDSLVSEQEKLIGLLKEKRQSVISDAVTKGLDPKVETKDTGIEWLGEIPKLWGKTQVGRVCLKISDGPHFSPKYVDDGVLFLSARNIGVEKWFLDDVKYISEEDYLEFSKRVIPEIGDILYTKGGTTGVAKVVDLAERFQVWVHVAVLKVDKNLIDPHFLSYSLNSIGCYEQSQLLTRGATNQDLGLTRMSKIWFALPPLGEQKKIVESLNDVVSKMDDLITESTNAINLLQERRSAVISEAVTGQIDVRSYEHKEVA